MTNINLDALVMQAIEAVKQHYAALHPEMPFPEFSSIPAEEQDEIKSAFAAIIRSTGLIEKVEALSAEVERLTKERNAAEGDMTEIADNLVVANVRFNQMFWISACLADPPSDLDELVQDDLWDADYILAVAPWIKEILDEGSDADEVVSEMYNRGMRGFIAQVATPSPHKFSADGKSWQTSWRSTRIEWLYADTLDDLCIKAVEWAEGVVAAARERAMTPAAVTPDKGAV